MMDNFDKLLIALSLVGLLVGHVYLSARIEALEVITEIRADD